MIHPALQTLIDEWEERWVGFSGGPSATMARQCIESLKWTLEQHPVVPLADLSALLDTPDHLLRGLVRGLVAGYSHRPPNPNPPGTYLWAREEHTRGRTVRRKFGPLADDWLAIGFNTPWEREGFRHADFTATDWEVVT
jgi:hypothetical protein